MRTERCLIQKHSRWYILMYGANRSAVLTDACFPSWGRSYNKHSHGSYEKEEEMIYMGVKVVGLVKLSCFKGKPLPAPFQIQCIILSKSLKDKPNASRLHCCCTLLYFSWFLYCCYATSLGTCNRCTLLDTISLKAFKMLLLVAQMKSAGRIKNCKATCMCVQDFLTFAHLADCCVTWRRGFKIADIPTSSWRWW